MSEHQLEWEPGQHGKGFLLKPTELGLRNFPQVAGAKPIIWTWPTKDMRPTHPQMKTKTFSQVPQGMAPEPSSYFHIDPKGGLYVYGNGRELTPQDHAAITAADSRLRPANEIPGIQPDSYGHAQRLLELVGGKRLGRWYRSRWSER